MAIKLKRIKNQYRSKYKYGEFTVIKDTPLPGWSIGGIRNARHVALWNVYYRDDDEPCYIAHYLNEVRVWIENHEDSPYL